MVRVLTTLRILVPILMVLVLVFPVLALGPIFFIVNFILNECSLIGNEPVFPIETVEDAIVLKRNWRIFRDDAMSSYGDFSSISKDLFFQGLIEKEGTWTKLYIKWLGHIDPVARRVCPATCSIIEKLPNVRIAFFSVLAPGAIIHEHRGLYKGHLRFHLGLSTPASDGCFMMLDGHRYRWQDGEGFLFDDTYMHRVSNYTTKPRIILFCDITRPLSSFGKIIDQQCLRFLGPLTHREN